MRRLDHAALGSLVQRPTDDPGAAVTGAARGLWSPGRCRALADDLLQGGEAAGSSHPGRLASTPFVLVFAPRP